MKDIAVWLNKRSSKCIIGALYNVQFMILLFDNKYKSQRKTFKVTYCRTAISKSFPVLSQEKEKKVTQPYGRWGGSSSCRSQVHSSSQVLPLLQLDPNLDKLIKRQPLFSLITCLHCLSKAYMFSAPLSPLVLQVSFLLSHYRMLQSIPKAINKKQLINILSNPAIQAQLPLDLREWFFLKKCQVEHIKESKCKVIRT